MATPGSRSFMRFDRGMMRDIPPFEMPAGACYDAADFLFDYPGKARKRGGTTSPASGNSAATVEHLVGYKSGGLDLTAGVYGTLGKGGTNVNLFNTSTGASTSMFTGGSNNTFACRPFQHNNLLVMPFQALGTGANDRNTLTFAGGGTAAGFSPTAATVTANDNRITGIAATSVAAGHLGAIIELDNFSVPGTHVYIGRIIEITSTSAVKVEPTPTSSFTATAGRIAPVWNFQVLLGGAASAMTGRYGVSFQNRIVLGYTMFTLSTTLTAGVQPNPNRIFWSQLQTEAFPASSAVPDGDVVLYSDTFLPFNYTDVPGLGPGGMTGLATAGEGSLLIFSARRTFRLTGQLASNTVANNALNYSVDQISDNVGCISAKSIQYARNGLIWAGYDNIYQYDGRNLKSLLDGTNARYYQDRLTAGDTIYGSAYSITRNHYYISMSGSDGGLMLNLDNNQLGRMTGVATQIFDSTPDPSTPTQLLGARWWDTTGAAPTMTKGQLHRLDPIWLPTSANKNDGDGTAVLPDIQSASQPPGDIGTNKVPTDLQVTYSLRGSGSPTATLKADTKLNTSDASYVTVTSALPNTGSATITDAWPVGNLLPDGPSSQVRFTLNAAADSFEIVGVGIGDHEGTPGYST